MKNITQVRKVDRIVVILIHDNNVLLMYRINQDKKYYIFPGGGIDAGETHREALERECMEETSIKIKPGRLLYEVDWDHATKQFFWACSYIEGIPALGDFNEREAMKDGTQFYDPQWIPTSQLKELLIYPLEIRDLIIHDIKNNFTTEKRDIYLEINTCRQSI